MNMLYNKIVMNCLLIYLEAGASMLKTKLKLNLKLKMNLVILEF